MNASTRKPGRLEDRAQRRLDRDVVAEHGEVRRLLRAGPEQRHGGRRRGGLEADREEDDLPVGQRRGERERVERRVDHPHVRAARLRLEQRPAATRHAHHVAERGQGDAGLLGEGDRVVDAPHRDHADGAAGAVDELDLGRQQVLEAVAVDRVRVTAAHLHHAPGLAGRHEPRDLGGEPPRQLRRAVLVDVLHARSQPASSAMPGVAEQQVARRRVRDEVDADALRRARRRARSPRARRARRPRPRPPRRSR